MMARYVGQIIYYGDLVTLKNNFLYTHDGDVKGVNKGESKCWGIPCIPLDTPTLAEKYSHQHLINADTTLSPLPDYQTTLYE